jgi:hypothetical protein
MVFNSTFNNISVISWLSVLSVGTPGKPIDLSQVTDKLDHIMYHRVHLAWAGFELTTSVVIDTNCKYNHHTITTTTPPLQVHLSWLCFWPWSLQVHLSWLCFWPWSLQVHLSWLCFWPWSLQVHLSWLCFWPWYQ